MTTCVAWPAHLHEFRCEECGKPLITVFLPNGSSVSIHDDGSICDSVVEFQPPTYVPGSRTDLHDKHTKKGTPARDTRYERAMG